MSETEFTSVDDPLNIHRMGMKKMLLLRQGKEKNDIFNDKFCEERLRIPQGKFGYNVSGDIPISPARYFNQPLLNFNECFASDTDYIQICVCAAPLRFINKNSLQEQLKVILKNSYSKR